MSVRSLVGRVAVLDLIRFGLLAAGIGFVVTGILPSELAEENLRRIAPLLVFLVAVIVLVELTKTAQFFDVVAARIAIAGRGVYWALFLLCTAFASLTTIFLNLDTTAVLLTPVMLALAARSGIAALPLAMTTVWLANTASLLLPVSNLTNLLAADRVALAPRDFAARMWAAQLVAIAVTMAALWALYWRRGARGAESYTPPEPEAVRDRLLCGAAAAACLGFVVAVLAGVHVEWAAGGAALALAAVFLWRDPSALRPALVPWQLLVFVTGLFLVVPVLVEYGLDAVMTALIGADDGLGGALRAAAVGAGLSNAINNLPAYTAGESAVPLGNDDQLLALLIGTNVGPLITPWASLATLLWFEWCRRFDLAVPIGRFAAHGALVAAIALPASVLALVLL
ncbi:SLC13 family permease [Actinocorallia sp. A-T 12471]|uniref:SLC13 family permease n=1 Tax=Actinocorallia sp. A-T 12471 TaxID=3089813 RepID=UPI0029D2C6B6|nr:SLC13 family permease [Actinocorallia sp. A-T 12471]MDX6742996.1 ArsB/NhaD family transporter [Actinocorallia sp. A-T 12471]